MKKKNKNQLVLNTGERKREKEGDTRETEALDMLISSSFRRERKKIL
jgi:hypothetical protein